MRFAYALLVASGVACGGGNTLPQDRGVAPGMDRTAKTAVLETGANLLQAKAPVEQIAMYLNGFHVAKDDPNMQMEAHHYCNQLNEELAQCVRFIVATIPVGEGPWGVAQVTRP